jgi:hypothetical protein
VPALQVEVLDTSVGATRVVIRVLTPGAGTAAAKAALESTKAEMARVAALTDGPELKAASEAAKRLGKNLGARIKPSPEELRAAYAVDRAVDRLSKAGMGDFYVDAGDVVRARGSQDASVGRGWHSTVFNVEGRAIGTARLRDQALSQKAGADPACTSVANSAVLAVAARLALESRNRTPEGPRGMGLRIGLSGGEELQNPAFQGLLTPVGAAY